MDSQMTTSGQVTYLAPIRARYQSEVDKRIGDYALIEVAHEIAESKPLFAGTEPESVYLYPYIADEWSTTRPEL